MSSIKKILAVFLIVLSQFVFLTPQKVFAATSPSLGEAASFAVLAGTAVTNVPTSVITGDVGLSPAAGSNYAGLTTGEVSGTIFAPDTSGPAGTTGDYPSLLTTAKTDLITAYDGLSAAPNDTCTIDYGAGNKDLVGLSLVPGVYCAGSFTLSGTLTLNDTGAAGGVWIFRSADTLITSPGSSVVFLHSLASSCNVWWKVASSATLDTTTTFIGNILALTSISMNTNATLQGRVLARNGAVTLHSNTINQSCSATHAGAPTPVPTLSPAGASSSYCPPLSDQTVAPSIVDSKRLSPTSISLSWAPYSGTNLFNVEYGPSNGNWLYNTNVTGFSTTLNSLPANQPVWVRVAARNDCMIGEYGPSELNGPAKLVGSPGLPNTGLAQSTSNSSLYLVSGLLAGTLGLLILIKRKQHSLAK